MSDNGTAVRYTPGNAVLLCNDRRAVMLRLVADHGLVGEAWARLEDGGSIDQVLELILGEGLRTVSEFALAERSGGSVRLILRGGINAEVRRHGNVEKLQTEGIWVDKRIEGDGVLALTVDGAEAGEQQLPLLGGIVLAGGALLTLNDASEHDAAPIVAPTEATDADAEPLAEQPEAEGAPEELAQQPEPQPELPAQSEQPMPVEPEVPQHGFQPEAQSEQPMPVEPEVPQHGFQSEAQPEQQGQHGFSPSADGGFPPPPPPVHLDGGFSAGMPSPAGSSPATSAPAGQPEWDESPAPAPSVGFQEERPQAAEDPFGATAPYAVGAVDGADEPDDLPTQMTHAASGTQYHGPVMILPDGQEIELAGPAIVGRAPKHHDSAPGARLVPVHDPNRDVSSTHLLVAFDGQRVMVTDLGSTNGTDLCVPGQPVRLLSPHEGTELVPGAHLLLAGSQKVTFEAR